MVISAISQLTNYVMHTPAGGLRTAASAGTLMHIIEGNQSYLYRQINGVTLERVQAPGNQS